MESQYYTDLLEILNKHAFLIHEEYLTYKDYEKPHMDVYIKPIWMKKYGEAWAEINKYSQKYGTPIFKITTILGDVVEFVPGVGYKVNGWI